MIPALFVVARDGYNMILRKVSEPVVESNNILQTTDISEIASAHQNIALRHRVRHLLVKSVGVAQQN
jgi:hypothetical protein